MEYGISILNYNSSSDAIHCVDSALEEINRWSDNKYHIVVVDNCSTDDSFEVLKENLKDEKYQLCSCIKTEKNGGFAYGNNKGIDYLRTMGARYIIVSNADVLFLKNSIELMINGLKSLSDAVIYAPIIYDNVGNITALPWKRAQSFQQYLGIKDTSQNLYSVEELKQNNPIQVYMVSGCCYGINTELFKKMGAFDENTFLYHEEGTVGQAALSYGYKTDIDIEAKIIHNHGASTGGNNIFVDTELIMSGLYYWRKYERASSFKLLLLWTVFSSKIVLKSIMNKYNTRASRIEVMNSISRTWKKLKEMRQF